MRRKFCAIYCAVCLRHKKLPRKRGSSVQFVVFAFTSPAAQAAHAKTRFFRADIFRGMQRSGRRPPVRVRHNTARPPPSGTASRCGGHARCAPARHTRSPPSSLMSLESCCLVTCNSVSRKLKDSRLSCARASRYSTWNAWVWIFGPCVRAGGADLRCKSGTTTR